MRFVSALCAVLASALLSPLAVLAQPAQPTPTISVPAEDERRRPADAKSAAESAVTADLVLAGTTNVLAKYVNGAAGTLGNSAVFETGGAVGLGTTTPFDRLHVRFTNTNGTFAGLAVQNLGNTAASFSGTLFYDQFGALAQFQGFNNVSHEYRINNVASQGSIHFLLGGSSVFKIAPHGNVGIGTATPTRAKLEINGGSGTYTINDCYYFGSNGPLSCAPGTYFGFSLYASSAVAAPSFRAFSDGRIKQAGRRSDAARDLQTLAGIEVTDYTYRDTVSGGAGPQKKVIGQQVEQVFPQAVSRTTDVVPDIYTQAQISDGWVLLATTLKKGDRVRLIGPDAEGVYDVLEVAPDRFRTAFAGSGDQVFVYGREVTDFRMVDYEALAMLNVSATQELHRRIEEQASDMALLRQQLSALEALVRAMGRVESTRVADARAPRQ